MAGKRLQKVMETTITKMGGLEVILDRVADGETVTAIARDLGVSRAMLGNWLNHERRVEQYALAKRRAAGALVEQSLDIVDEADPSTVQVAKLRADTRRWIASKLDRESWGEDKGPTVAIQINDLHLGALRQGGRVLEGDGD